MAKVLTIWAAVFVLTAAATALCVVYIDRPALEFSIVLSGTPVGKALDHFLDLVALVVPAGILVLLVSGVWRASRKPLPAWLDTPLLCSWAIVFGLAAERAFKHLFGRYTTWFYQFGGHRYGFYWLHGDPSQFTDSLPSGTAIVTLAIVTVIWTQAPWLRASVTAIGALTCSLAVLLAYHWAGDVVAGMPTGVFIGWATVHLLKSDRPPDQPPS